MSAQLYPGIKAVHLVLQQPHDLIRTADIRDDLQSIKVWYSSLSGFDPNLGQGTLYSEGNSLVTTITGLSEDTTYYVKYAFVSKIDPTTYTVSSQLTAKTLAAGVHVYGYLTNDPVGVSTNSSGNISVTVNGALVANPTQQQQTDAWQSATAGVFKVYNDNEDVTARNDATLGPVYGIKPNSYVDGLSASNVHMNTTTGAYYITGMTTGYDNGSVTFQATFNGVTIERVWSVYRGKAGQLAPIIQLTSTGKEFVYKNVVTIAGKTTSYNVDPASIRITANLTNLTGQPVFTTKAYSRGYYSGNTYIASTELGTGNLQIGFTQTGNYIDITSTQFSDPIQYSVDVGFVVVTATIGNTSDSMTIYRLVDGTDNITVEQSNPVHTMSAAANGDLVTQNYIGSGNTITVKKGINTLLVDNNSPYQANTWRIHSVDQTHNITADQYPEIGSDYIRYDPMSAMTADDAYLDYTVRVQLVTGDGLSASQYQDYVVRQSFAKSKQGIQGSTARAVNLTANSGAFITPKNSNTTTVSTITLTATESNFINPIYTWTVNGSAPGSLGTASGNTFTLNSFAAGGSKLIRVTVSEPSPSTYSEFDEISIFSLKEGDDAIAATLSNENQTISCDSTGTVKPGQFPFTTTFLVAQGNTLINGTTTPSVVFAKVTEAGMTSSINSSTGLVTVTALNTEFASAIYSATIGSIVITKTLTLNKSIEGSDAPVVNLSASTQLFIGAKNSTAIAPSNITLTASGYNVGTSPGIVWKIDGAVQSGQTGYTLTVPSFSSGNKVIRVEFTVNGTVVFDQVTLYYLKEGDDGIAAGLVNENQTITCDDTGLVIGGQLPLTSSLGAARGASILAYPQVSFSKVSETGITTTIDAQTGIISVTAVTASLTTLTMSATFRATVGSVYVDRTLTINKSLNGKKGTDGKSTYTATVYLKNANYLTVGDVTAPQGGSYNFDTNALTAPTGWTTTQPDSDSVTPTFAASYTFVATTVGATVPGGTWGNIRIIALNGAQSTTPGPRNSSGYLYYQVSTSSGTSASSIPTPDINTATWNWATASFTPTSNWSYNVFTPAAGEKAWAVRYTVTQTTYSGPISVTYSTAFTSLAFDGLVTFTNNLISSNSTVTSKLDANGAASAANTAISNSLSTGGSLYNALSGKADTSALSAKADSANVFKTNTTQIDGGKIATDSISAGSLKIGTIPQNANGNYIKMEDSRIVVYSSNQPRVIIGDLSL